MMPSHYLKQFHPEYGKNVPKDWDTVGGLMESKADWHRNPDCPTMTGFRCKSFDNTKGVVLERNPYYYAVMPNGDQLPYVDEIQINVDQRRRGGQAPGAAGRGRLLPRPLQPDHPAGRPGLRDSAEPRRRPRCVLWDSGSGTGSIFFFNYDYIDDDVRELIREPKFRQALSHAFNREAVQKSVYFNTGEPTTGHATARRRSSTRSTTPASRLYQQWRDCVRRVRPGEGQAAARRARREGQRRRRHARAAQRQEARAAHRHPGRRSVEHETKDNQLISDLKAVGIAMTSNPIAPQAFDDQWKSGKLIAHSNWEVGDGPNHLI